MYRSTGVFPIFVDKDFAISFELLDLGANRLMPMLHLEFSKFNKSSFLRYKAAHALIRPRLPQIIYVQSRYDNPLFAKFVSRIGFKPLGDGYCNDGVNRLIYVNTAEQL